jgi:hypothetical protein
MQEVMSMEFAIGNKEVDEKIKEWLHWDKVHCIFPSYVYYYKLRVFDNRYAPLLKQCKCLMKYV